MLSNVLPPILPDRARELGADESVIALLFALFPAAVLLLSPICGWLSGHVGRTRVLCAGLAVSGASSLAFGYCANLPLLCILRFLNGVGSAATWSAAYSLLSECFPAQAIPLIGMTEAAGGLGCMIAPVVAAELVSAFGFAAPFLAIGVGLLTQLVLLPLAVQVKHRHCSLDSSKQQPSSLEHNETSDHSSCQSLRSILNVTLLLCAANVLLVECMTFALSPFYADFLEAQFQMSLSSIGVTLTASSAAYSLAAPFVGSLARRFGSIRTMSLGLFLLALSSILLGTIRMLLADHDPTCSPFIHSSGPMPALAAVLPDNQGARLAVLFCSLAGLGFGAAIAFVPALPTMLESIKHLGPSASGTVAGSFYALFSFGQAIGPFVGAALFEKVGFEMSVSDSKSCNDPPFSLTGVLQCLDSSLPPSCRRCAAGGRTRGERRNRADRRAPRPTPRTRPFDRCLAAFLLFSLSLIALRFGCSFALVVV